MNNLKKLVKAFADNYDYLVLTKSPNLAYAVGMPDAVGLLLELNTGFSTLYVSRLDYTRAKAIAQVDKVVAISSTEMPPRRPGEELVIVKNFAEFIKEISKGKRVASDNKELGVDVSESIAELRAIKENWEVELIKEALRITEGVYRKLSEKELIGMRERDVAALIYKWFVEDGADGVAFDPIVASGPNGAYPHYRFGDRKISYGDYIVIDIGAKRGVYCSDMTRTFTTGHTGVLKDAIYAVYEAIKAAEKTAREGVSAADVDKAARDVIAEYGFSQYFIHSTGHGVGVEVHERPRLYAASKDVLKRGNIITIEPGVYIEGVGGVRIEDMVYIDSSAIVLNKLPHIL
ncbi:transcriptional regulator, Fis family [Pyrobaculum islandicum DSM 4184]|uniref:Transcriptional regulator, Fis family n=1 Tax=Pyrobaculum islandicum (strain DSM 4184 / JCM 9189 / GEO3) TaxID=384616 RepID=A1RSH4_PYRIL|nr:aminopeptidase P family protein [Pyrobaculum islandicum]ABL87906.1 transcriptional regulator, Fis family [Pyrobaculum islandicum DSM 4184]